MKISPELIPHTEFHTGLWLKPEKTEWYYFMKKRNTYSITEAGFEKTVDKPLRKLVNFLHSRGIKTTPSCAGHFIKKKDLGKKFSELLKDGEKIREKGLILKDIQNGKKYVFRDKNYQLPWRKKEYIKEFDTYQQKGIIGMVLEGTRRRSSLLNIQIEGLKIIDKAPLLLFLMDHPRKKQNREAWKELTKKVKSALN